MKLVYTYLFTFFLFAFAAKAQYNNDFYHYSNYGKGIYLNGEYNLNSNALTNAFVNKFYTGGHIDSTTKAGVSARLAADNRVGGNASYNIMACLAKDSSDYGFMISIQQQDIFNANFSKDLFNTAFYGNKQYLGQAANLGNSSVNYYRFQELKLGMLWNNVDTSAKMGISVSYLKGQNMMQIRTNSTELYTSSDGSEIQFTTNASLSMSDTNNKSISAFNGNGASVDLYAELPYNSTLGKSKFFLSVSNLGFIRWSNKTLNYTVDSTFKYNGIYVSNLFDVSDSTLNNISKDSIITNSTELRRDIFSTNLPTAFLIMHKIEFSRNFSLNAGFRHLFQANHKPYIFLETEFKFTKNFTGTFHLAYGGYGKLSAGLWLSYLIKDHIALRLGSNAIQGFVSPSTSLGQGAYFSIVKLFRTKAK